MLQLLDMPLALVDLETTGPHAQRDRITEVGILHCQNDAVPESWEQLLNPQVGIPEFIQQLTGITPQMLIDQPLFEELAASIWERLEGRLFIAHNARFDYSFLKTAFKLCGYDFRPKVVCTLKLSRELFPNWPKHNLDAICQQIAYPRSVSHRAMADVQAMFAFLCYAVKHCGENAVNAAVAKQLKRPALPAHLADYDIGDIPEQCGVYYLYGEDDCLLYVGKSNNMRKRVMSHFRADLTNGKSMKLAQAVRTIKTHETLGELGALLLENREIKQRAPIYNQRQRRLQSLWVWRMTEQPNGYLRASLDKDPAEGWRVAENVFGPFRGKGKAAEVLKDLIREHHLCNRILGLESGTGPCFARQLNQCKGACECAESAMQHNLRLLTSLQNWKLQAWPYAGPIAIQEESFVGTERCYHIVDQWVYLGVVHDLQELHDTPPADNQAMFDVDTYRLIYKCLAKGKHKVFPMPQLG